MELSCIREGNLTHLFVVVVIINDYFTGIEVYIVTLFIKLNNCVVVRSKLSLIGRHEQPSNCFEDQLFANSTLTNKRANGIS